MNAVDQVRQALTDVCRGYWTGGVGHGHKRLTLRSLPLLTDKTFAGVPLRKVMSPAVARTGIENEALFDTWLWPVHSGEGNQQEDLQQAGSPSLVQFVMRGETPAEQTLRLLYALSNAEGAKLTFDRDTMLVQHDQVRFGIENGVVKSRFCNGMELELEANPYDFMHRTPDIRVQGIAFSTVWRQAYRKGQSAADAAVALYMGQPTISWQKILNQALPKKVPSKRHFDSWIEILNSPEDPVGKLYTKLVPRWMSVSEFGVVICRVKTRPMQPSIMAQQGYISRLYTHFHLKNKREKEQ